MGSLFSTPPIAFGIPFRKAHINILLDIGEFGYDDDLRFCEELAEKVGVGAVPGSSFFREPVRHLIRLHFAKQESTLEEALNRLEHLREKMR